MRSGLHTHLGHDIAAANEASNLVLTPQSAAPPVARISINLHNAALSEPMPAGVSQNARQGGHSMKPVLRHQQVIVTAVSEGEQGICRLKTRAS